MKIGDKVSWDDGKKKRTGTIHGVQKSENSNGTEKVIGYIVDTGKDLVKAESRKVKNVDTKKDDIIEIQRQPETVILSADQVTAA